MKVYFRGYINNTAQKMKFSTFIKEINYVKFNFCAVRVTKTTSERVLFNPFSKVVLWS